ncbi:hypothetical protein IKG10_01205 [Candidatus Saccharibacteria bacterium]|nr:hypothetical protein [Candidatus Saccharibacteria bacterium]
MPKLTKLAEQICIVGRQAGIPRSTNEIGRGADIREALSPFSEALMDWNEPDSGLKAWLGGEDLVPEIRVWPRVDHVEYISSDGLLLVAMVRDHDPTSADYDAYAKRCGCSSSDEAVRRYGDLERSIDRKEVLVKSAEVGLFQDLIVPYCWQN